jgi:hypothetical protein
MKMLMLMFEWIYGERRGGGGEEGRRIMRMSMIVHFANCSVKILIQLITQGAHARIREREREEIGGRHTALKRAF